MMPYMYVCITAVMIPHFIQLCKPSEIYTIQDNFAFFTAGQCGVCEMVESGIIIDLIISD